MNKEVPRNANYSYSAPHHDKKPFPGGEREALGQGKESITRKYGDHYVIKEIRTTIDNGVQKSSTELATVTSREYLASFRQDQEKLSKIYGDQLPEIEFITGLDEQGKETVYRLQERVDGPTVSEERKNLGTERFNEEYRQELLRMHYATKKATAEFEIPTDVHAENVLVDRKSGKLKLIDSGPPPTIARSKIRDWPDKERRDNAYKHIDKIFNQLSNYENKMNVTNDERVQLSDEYNYTEDDEQKFQQSKQAWEDEMTELNIK